MQVLLVEKGQRFAMGWSVLVRVLIFYRNLNRLLYLQPLLVSPVRLCLCTLRRIIHARQVAERLVACSTRWYCNLESSIGGLVELLPVLVGRPAGIIGITLALVVDTIYLLCLTNPLRSQDTIGGQQYGCKQREATHDERKRLKSGAGQLATRYSRPPTYISSFLVPLQVPPCPD